MGTWSFDWQHPALKSRRLYLCLSGLSVLLSAAAASAVIAANAGPKYTASIKLRQFSHVNGDETIWISPEGLRVDNPRSHVIYVAKAPDWLVYTYSLETKNYSTTAWDAVRNRITGTAALFGGIVLVKATTKPAGTEQSFGYKLNKFVNDEAFTKKALDMFLTAHTVRASYPQTFTYKTLSPDMFPPQVAHILSAMHDVPDLHGVPLDLSYTSLESKKAKYLTTQEIVPTTLTQPMITLPAGFVKVKDEGTVATGRATQKDMLDFVEGLGQKDKARH